MAIPGMSGATPLDPMSPTNSTSSVEAASTEEAMFVNDGHSEAKAEAQKKQAAATKALTADIKNGNARYNIKILGDDVDLAPDGNMTLRDIEKRYNLPQGTLNDEKTDINGYYATQRPAGGVVNVSAKTLAKSLGKDTEKLKDMFPEGQQTTGFQRAKEAAKELIHRVKKNFK